MSSQNLQIYRPIGPLADNVEVNLFHATIFSQLIEEHLAQMRRIVCYQRTCHTKNNAKTKFGISCKHNATVKR